MDGHGGGGGEAPRAQQFSSTTAPPNHRTTDPPRHRPPHAGAQRHKGRVQFDSSRLDGDTVWRIGQTAGFKAGEEQSGVGSDSYLADSSLQRMARATNGGFAACRGSVDGIHGRLEFAVGCLAMSSRVERA